MRVHCTIGKHILASPPSQIRPCTYTPTHQHTPSRPELKRSVRRRGGHGRHATPGCNGPACDVAAFHQMAASDLAAAACPAVGSSTLPCRPHRHRRPAGGTATPPTRRQATGALLLVLASMAASSCRLSDALKLPTDFGLGNIPWLTNSSSVNSTADLLDYCSQFDDLYQVGGERAVRWRGTGVVSRPPLLPPASADEAGAIPSLPPIRRVYLHAGSGQAAWCLRRAGYAAVVGPGRGTGRGDPQHGRAPPRPSRAAVWCTLATEPPEPPEPPASRRQHARRPPPLAHVQSFSLSLPCIRLCMVTVL